MDELIFAGIDFSSGRQPVTFAALDEALNLILLEKYEVAHLIAHVKQYSHLTLAIGIPSTKIKQKTHSYFKRKITQTGLKPYGIKAIPKQWFETNSQDGFRTLIGKSPLPRRTLEGRVQRGLILFEQGLRITDPMDFFEEITRHHMLGGVFPNELLYSPSELDALVAAYVAWLAVNEPCQITPAGGGLFLPKSPEHD